MFARGTPGNTLSTTPTRQFAFVVDPNCLPQFSVPRFSGIVPLIYDLQRIDPPITINFALPTYLAGPEALGYGGRLRGILREFDRADDVPNITLSKRLPRKHRDRLSSRSEDGRRAGALLGLAEFIQADGVITEDQILKDARYPLLQHHRLRIIPLMECAGWLEVCAHGHDVFWSATEYNRNLIIDIFYQWTHPKNRRLVEWFLLAGPRLRAYGVEDDIRNLFLNRYPFLLYSRDMVKFYELQMDHFTRRRLERRFVMPLGYYLSNFYLHLWGSLDHLTVIAAKALGLDVEQRACGIENMHFWRALGRIEPGLRAFMRSPKMVQWLEVMADMRHAVAHREMLLPSPMVSETVANKKSDAEISEILQREDPDFYEGLSSDAKEILEPQRIWLWRMNQLETVAANVVVVKKQKGSYIRSPVDSVDYDLEMLTAVIDAFIVAVFSVRERAVPDGEDEGALLARAVRRLLVEVQWIRNEQAALKGLSGRDHIGLDFFKVAHAALLGDRLLRLTRIFEESDRVASFWYVAKGKPEAVEMLLIRAGVSKQDLRDFSHRLKQIRNRVFVHIDKQAVFEPAAVYAEAGITADMIARTVDAVFMVLAELDKEMNDTQASAEDYNGQDIGPLHAGHMRRVRRTP